MKQSQIKDNGNIPVTFDPTNDDQPDDSTGGASRGSGGSCVEDDLGNDVANTTENTLLEFLPLIPETNYGLTTAERPTFYAYVPKSKNLEKINFIIWNPDDDTDYKIEFSIPNTGGIVSFSLPEDAPPLEIGKWYQWSMVLMCNQTMTHDSPEITSLVKRVEPLPILLITTENPISLGVAALYAKNGIWYDSLHILANLWGQSDETSTDYSEQWVEFLSQDSVGLGAIANQPLLTETLMPEYQ